MTLLKMDLLLIYTINSQTWNLFSSDNVFISWKS